MKKFDLLSMVEYGGCSSKLDPKELNKVLGKFMPSLNVDHNLLVGVNTHDDAAVYRINDDSALIFTTDFFPPLCSEPKQYGRIAAANALSDVYAMGGKPLLALNIVMFPSSGPLEMLSEILEGGNEKVIESGAMTVGGHTIDDKIPKYGLAVVGMVNPNELITNNKMRDGDVLILTKPLGASTILAAHKSGIVNDDILHNTLVNMEKLNADGARIMRKYNVTGATDITGFGLVGHAMQSAEESCVTFVLESSALPYIESVKDVIDMGCIPGATFRNYRYVSDKIIIGPSVNQVDVYLAADAQTSGGLLFGINPEYAEIAIRDLKDSGYTSATIIGEVVKKRSKPIYIV